MSKEIPQSVPVNETGERALLFKTLHRGRGGGGLSAARERREGKKQKDQEQEERRKEAAEDLKRLRPDT
ncbi:hypothetical protein EYF80_042041 [Liparis tanakae]|uniref:Uncharacterized protein n=1 Tax=Liparis tanakae TaxID=230148 RepID=A0A4Z2G2P6_9TELE|nr:hypothetical protein EYF80_042041 [Liparis tanakae]